MSDDEVTTIFITRDEALVSLTGMHRNMLQLVRRHAWMIAACAGCALVCSAIALDSMLRWWQAGGDTTLMAACLNIASAATCAWRAGVMTHTVVEWRRTLAGMRRTIESIKRGTD